MEPDQTGDVVRGDGPAALSPFGIVNVLARQLGIHPKDIRRGTHKAPVVRARRAIARSMVGLGWERAVIARAMGHTVAAVIRWTDDDTAGNHADFYRDRVERGVCGRCGASPPRPRQRLCERCRAKNTLSMHDRAATQRAGGPRHSCAICGKPGYNSRSHDLHGEKLLHVEPAAPPPSAGTPPETKGETDADRE